MKGSGGSSPLFRGKEGRGGQSSISKLKKLGFLSDPLHGNKLKVNQNSLLPLLTLPGGFLNLFTMMTKI